MKKNLLMAFNVSFARFRFLLLILYACKFTIYRKGFKAKIILVSWERLR